MNFGFIIDNRKCIGCHACTVACKSEHDVPLGVNRTWVKYIEKGQFPNTRRIFSVMRCNHCDDAPCVEICPVSALFIRGDGIVDFDNRRCIGCKACTQACPYDALYMDPDSLTAAKCNYCAHRVDVGLEPACVNVCPEHAIISGDLDDPSSEIAELLAREQVTARKVEKGTKPKLFYIDGDESSLSPTATEVSQAYMWSTQSSGVGHFARYAESRLADRAGTSPHAQSKDGSKTSTLEPIRQPAPPAEATADDAAVSHVSSLQPWEHNKRVYDAPNKGTLWGWEVSAYVWTKAISTGALLVPFLAVITGIISTSATLHWLGIGLALVFLTITGVLLVVDLDQPRRFLYVLLRPQWKSWLVRGGYAIMFYGLSVTVLAVSRLAGWSKVESLCWWLSAVMAIITAVYTAFLFAQAKGRDFWQAPTLTLHMIIHAFLAGGAVMAIGSFLNSDPNWLGYVRVTLFVGLGLNLIVIASELLTPHPTSDAKKTVTMIVSGRFKLVFWLGCILLGHLLPAATLTLFGTDLIAVAGALVLVGLLITEHIWVRAPQLIPLS